MKGNLLIYLMAMGGVFLSACGDDDPPVDPIVGVWQLDEITISEAPTAYNSNNGFQAANLFGEESYTIEFFADFRYERELTDVPRLNGTDAEDNGVWELDDDELLLDRDDGDEFASTEFELEEDITIDDLVLSRRIGLIAYPDSILSNQQIADTVDTDEEAAIIDSLFLRIIDVKVTMEFEKQ